MFSIDVYVFDDSIFKNRTRKDEFQELFPHQLPGAPLWVLRRERCSRLSSAGNKISWVEIGIQWLKGFPFSRFCLHFGHVSQLPKVIWIDDPLGLYGDHVFKVVTRCDLCFASSMLVTCNDVLSWRGFKENQERIVIIQRVSRTNKTQAL